MPPQRLPIVNSDDGTWGDILRQYLLKEHYDDGTNNAANGGHKTITIRAGTASAGTAPLKFTSGTLLTTPEAGAVEFLNDTLYFTQTTGPTRRQIVTDGATQTLTNKTLVSPEISGTVQFPQNTTLELYNTSDQVTNYEKAVVRYNSNILEVGHIYGGTGATKAARFGTSGAANNLNRYIQVQGSTPFISYQWSGTLLTGHAVNIGSGNSFLASSGSQVALGIDPIINQSGTASYTALLINPTETGIGSGSKLLIDAQVGGSSKFKVDNTGGTTTGNLTATSAGSNGISLTGNLTDTSSTVTAVSAIANINPGSSSSATYRAFNMSATVPTANSQTLTGALYGAWIESRYQGTGSVSTIAGAYTAPVIPAAGQSFGTITNSYGLQSRGFIEFSGSSISGTVTNAISLQAVTNSKTNTGVDIQNAIGVDVQSQTYGSSSNIGVRIAKSDTYTLQLSDTGGTAAGGITFGTDTNLYRSAANTLRTDDNLVIGTVGSSAGSVVVIDGSQTLTNKTLTSPIITNPQIPTSIYDSNWNQVIDLVGIGSAVNHYYVTNQSAGNYPTIGVDGTDSNIGIALAPKGSGPVRVYVSAGQTPVIDAAGPDTNLNINLVPKGTGAVQQNGVNVATVSGSQTLTNKTINLSSNTISGTTAQFNTALSDGNFAVFDGNNNFSADTFIKGATWTTASGGTTVLSINSTQVQAFSGSANHTVRLPTTSVVSGQSYTIVNATNSGTITVQSSNGDIICTIPFNGAGVFTAGPDTPVDQGNWVGNVVGAGAVFSVTNTMTFSGNDGTFMTFPSSSDDIVGEVATQTLTNKTISGANNTLIALPYDLTAVAFGYVSPRTTGTGDFPFGIKLQRACTFTSVTYRCNTADASGNLVVELRKNGVAVSGTSASIAAASQISGGTVTGSWSFSVGDILTVYVTGVGTTPGNGLIADIMGVTA